MGTYGAAELADAFATVRKNTIQIAEDIPESQYHYVAAPEVKSVAAQFAHIAFAPMMYEDMHRHKRVTTLTGYDFGGIVSLIAVEENKPRSKAELIDLLRSEGDRYVSWLRSLTPEFLAETFTFPAPSGVGSRSRLESLLSPKEHEMHHRAQLMLIERMLGIVPHLTRQRQARTQQSRAAV